MDLRGYRVYRVSGVDPFTGRPDTVPFSSMGSQIRGSTVSMIFEGVWE